MPPWLYRVTATAPLHQTHGTHLALWATVMVPQTPAPLRKGREGREKKGEYVSGGPSYNASVPQDPVHGS